MGFHLHRTQYNAFESCKVTGRQARDLDQTLRDVTGEAMQAASSSIRTAKTTPCSRPDYEMDVTVAGPLIPGFGQQNCGGSALCLLLRRGTLTSCLCPRPWFWRQAPVPLPRQQV